MQAYSNNALSADVIDWPVYMRQALRLAGTVLTAAPNPRVGCVIVKSGQVIAEGWHIAAGLPHAEVMALQQAGAAAQSATAFVTLEPCAHTGRTGPCTEALIAAGIKQVVIAAIDPNPAVAGKGVQLLEAAGIEVIHLVDFEPDARALNRGYFKRRQQGRPFVRCKLAMSLDGRTALANGESKWITGKEARADVQLLRARSCAVVTGIGTLLADDPALTVRAEELPLTEAEMAHNAVPISRQPLRVILDTRLRTPPGASTLQRPGQVVIYTADDVAEKPVFPGNVAVLGRPAAARGVALDSVLESLAADFQCNEILVEAGAALSAAFIAAGLVDELLVYIAPKLLGKDGRALVDIAGIQSMSDSINFQITDVSLVGNDKRDIRVTLVPPQAAGD